MKTKEEIIAKIEKEFKTSFKIGHIHVFQTHGAPEEWIRVKRFALDRMERIT